MNGMFYDCLYFLVNKYAFDKENAENFDFNLDNEVKQYKKLIIS